MIRELTVEELPLIFPIGKHFWAESDLPGSFIEEEFMKSWTAFIGAGAGTIFGAFDERGNFTGALACLVYRDLNDGKQVSMEAFWYVFKEHRGQGVRLLKHYEEWAKAKGISRVAMGFLHSIHPEKMADLYKRLGYRILETIYVKDL